MAFATNDCISSAVSAAGLNAAIDAGATAGSSVKTCGALMGGDMNTGWFESGLVARMTGEIGLDTSLPGVRLGGVLNVDAVTGVLRVETEEVE